MHHVDDFAAVVQKRLEHRLDRGDIRGLRRHRGATHGPRREADDRQHLTGGWDRPLNELSALLLECAEQLRTERQCSAGAKGDSEKFATIDHWRVESGEWRVESGEWGVGSGEWGAPYFRTRGTRWTG